MLKEFASACLQRARSWQLPPPPSVPAWLPRPGAPRWRRAGARQRLTLFANHVLMQHPEAMGRMAQHHGRQMQWRWREFSCLWQWTPAGLLEVSAHENHLPDLHLEVLERSTLQLARHALLDDVPDMRIQGDPAMARDMRWLLEHVRWDVEDDLARTLGETPARAAARMLGGLRQALCLFCARHPAHEGMPTQDTAPASP